ncbi:hypothetical protein AMS68_000234 [Peltaster fructicola]|uniref:DUF6590 domain-containing protein n=1 Tax=Peltaster fructicola TaxID=286661 RepID=A0A6H0XJ14_9PEZI|nr:hypothetical protein AMS68_000234 [Peltaster fructicola]
MASRSSAARPVAAINSQRQPQQRDRPRASQTSDQQEDLATRMAMARLRANPFPAGLLSRNPEDENELYARVIVDRTSAPSGMRTAITRADIDGMPTAELYPEYKSRKKDFFFLGKVFSILWAEPASTTLSPSAANTAREQAVVKGPYGELIFSKIRRFVVIREGDGYCNALPISTYSGQGVGKRGVVKHEHAIIYTTPEPKPMPGERPSRDEEPLRPIAIRVDPDNRAEKLHHASRINFGHPHTIQHNVKVKSCGKVGREFLDAMTEQFQIVFTPGIRGSSQSESSRNETRTAPASGSTADDVVHAGIVRLMANSTREEAVRRMLQMLEDRGIPRQEAMSMIRNALS